MPTPRTRHAALVVGGEILLCGGMDERGGLLPTCDVLDANTLARLRSIPLGAARSDGRLLILDGGYVALVGGSGEGGAPVASLEIYRP